MAEPSPMVEPAPIPPVSDVVPPPVQTRWRPSSGFGLALMAGGGATDFTNSTTRVQTNTGGAWFARMAFGTRSIIGGEASYIGGANTVYGLNTNATLVRNGLEGVVRINAPLHAQDALLEPFIFGGVGWNAYHLTNVSSAALASVSTGTDNTLSVPAGLGFAFGYHGFMADIRATYRPTYNQTVFQNQSGTALTNWDAGGMLGYEF